MTAKRVLLVAVLLVLAGCSGPFGGGGGTDGPAPTDADVTPTATTDAPVGTETTTTEPTTTGTTTTQTDSDEYKIYVTHGELPINPTRTYARVENLLGSDVRPPTTIEIKDPDQIPSVGNTSLIPDALHPLGIVFESSSSGVSGFAPSETRIVLNRAILKEPKFTEQTLAHEFVHTVQHRKGWYATVYSEIFSDKRPDRLDSRLTIGAVFEGSATYVQVIYARRYINDTFSAVDRGETVWRSDDLGASLGVAPYLFGQRYIAQRIDSPRNLSAIYENPPRTTETLLHGYAPGAEPPAELAVSIDTDGWTVSGDPLQVGELATRVVLRAGVNATRAAAGADGWGNDRLFELQPSADTASSSDRRGYAWVLRWDDSANATEFADNFQLYLQERATRENGLWQTPDGTAFRLVRTSDRTTAVLYGAEAFVRNASVTGGANVTVSVP